MSQTAAIGRPIVLIIHAPKGPALKEGRTMSQNKFGRLTGDCIALLVGLLLASQFFLVLVAQFVGGW